MIITKGNDFVSSRVTELVLYYIKAGYLIRNNDSSMGYMSRVELKKPGEEIYIRIAADIVSGEQRFNQNVVIEVTQQSGSFTQAGKPIISDLYNIIVKHGDTLVLTDSEDEFAQIEAKREDRYPSKNPNRHIAAEQSQLRKLVKGRDGFGKKSLANATLSLYKQGNKYVIVSDKTDKKAVFSLI